MVDRERAILIATERLQQVYAEPEFLSASHVESLEEFDKDAPGWRVWFRVIDQDFGTYERPVEVADETEEARLVRIYL